MPLHILSSPRFAEHVTPSGHPERRERADVFDAVAARWHSRGGALLEPRPATREELSRVHAEHYVDGVAKLAGRTVELDPDTYTCPATAEVACLAAGGVCVAVEHTVAATRARPGARAPARATTPRRTRRWASACSTTSRSARRWHGPWGCGESPSSTSTCTTATARSGCSTRTRRCSTSPRTSSRTTRARARTPRWAKGDGTGFTVNLPIEAGATDADYDLVFREAVIPVLEQFAPDLLMVSAGFDAHHRDPLAMMRVSTEGFATILGHLHAFASRRCEGRLVVVSEGGYDLQALSDGLETTVELLEQPARVPAPIHGDSARGRETLEKVQQTLRAFWTL